MFPSDPMPNLPSLPTQTRKKKENTHTLECRKRFKTEKFLTLRM